MKRWGIHLLASLLFHSICPTILHPHPTPYTDTPTYPTSTSPPLQYSLLLQEMTKEEFELEEQGMPWWPLRYPYLSMRAHIPECAVERCAAEVRRCDFGLASVKARTVFKT